jgi:hypothetical protein
MINYNIGETQKSLYADSTIRYVNKFKIKKQPIPYFASLTGRYAEKDDASTWSATGSLRMSVGKRKRLMPGLTATSKIDATYRRRQSQAGQSSGVYSIGLSDQIASKQIKNLTFYAGLNTGYSESGVPLRISARAVYRKSSRLILYGSYGFSTSFLSEYRGRSYSHSMNFGVNYRISSKVKYHGEIEHRINSTENGHSYSYSNTQIKSDISWDINSRSNFDASANYYFSGNYRYMAISMQYRNRIQTWGTIYIGARLAKANSRKANKQLDMGYSTRYRKLSFNVTYRLSISGGGVTTHKLTVRLSRTFGRVLGKLW